MVLCPSGWYDMDMATQLGISLEAMRYSLGYYEFDLHVDLENVDDARDEFITYYDNTNFSDLSQYYDSIAIDLIEENSTKSLANSSFSSYFCSGCRDTPSMRTVFTNVGMCYVFPLKPTRAGSGRKGKIVVVKLADQSGLMAQGLHKWDLYFPPDLDAAAEGFPPLTIRAGARSIVIVNAIQLSTIRKNVNGTAPCKELGKNDNYKIEECMARCKHAYMKSILKCDYLPLSSFKSRHPVNFCNAFDNGPDRNISLAEYVQTKEITAALSQAKCFTKCPYPCERVMYLATLHSETPLAPTDIFGLRESTVGPNVSFVYVKVLHSAVYQGGVVTLTEKYTYSFSNLISDVGGTLGLFVGGTCMTIVQLVLFIVDYVRAVRIDG